MTDCVRDGFHCRYTGQHNECLYWDVTGVSKLSLLDRGEVTEIDGPGCELWERGAEKGKRKIQKRHTPRTDPENIRRMERLNEFKAKSNFSWSRITEMIGAENLSEGAVRSMAKGSRAIPDEIYKRIEEVMG